MPESDLFLLFLGFILQVFTEDLKEIIFENAGNPDKVACVDGLF